jgi:hypothetical protein
MASSNMMRQMPIVSSKTLESTKLFRRLLELQADGVSPSDLAGSVLRLCEEAAERLKSFPILHPQFTLHDERHSLRIVEIMHAVLGRVVEQLDGIEIALLILSAYFHDQGMVVNADELIALKSSSDWSLHEQRWIADHPNFTETQSKLADPLLTSDEQRRLARAIADLEGAMFTDFIRVSHGQRSAEFIIKQYGNDARLTVQGRSLAQLLADICRSHVLPGESISVANGFRYDELVGTTPVNTSLIAIALRLSDILDFDRERTPDSLFRAIHFASPISLEEWQKHRSISGWDISSDRILFTAECEHPAYERSIRAFLGWIDEELVIARRWSRLLPAEFQRYALRPSNKTPPSAEATSRSSRTAA